MSDRAYRAARSSRTGARDPYDNIEPVSRQRSQIDYDYEDPYVYPGGSRDGLSRVTTRSERGTDMPSSGSAPTTKTTYRVAQDKNADNYVTKGNVIVLDSRLDRDRDLSDWEIIRPERSESGAYVIETSSASDYASPGRGRDYFSDENRRPNMRRDIEVLSPHRSGRERSMSRGTLRAMREVRVTEDYSSEDDHYSNRPPGKSRIDTVVAGRPSLRRLPSSLRHDHSPESVTRRRSRSIGFVRDQIGYHDVSESKHERPGAEASNAGRYLIDHRGERFNRRDGDDDESSLEDYPSQKTKIDAIDTYGAEVERRRRDARGKSRYDEDEYDGRRGPYPPQSGRRRYRRGDDDDESRYSEHYDKRASKKYY